MNLHHPAMTGDASTLRAALAEGGQVESRDEHGRTPLMVAASANRAEAIRILLESGANPDARSEPRDLGRNETPVGTPGEVAVRHGLLELIVPIVGGQDPVKRKRTSADGPAALIIAATFGHEEAVGALLASGATVDLRERDGFSALSYASALGHAGVVRRLLQAGAEVDQIDHYKMKPVVLAALFGHAEAVRALLCEAGADTSPADRHAYGALHAAASHGHAEAVRVLVASGANPDETCYGQKALQMALREGHAEVVDALASSPEVDRDAPDGFKVTPLMRAVAKADLATMRALLRSGADPNATVRGEGRKYFSGQSLPDGASALHLAACLADPAFASALIAAGARVHDRDSLGFSPLMLAVVGGNDKTAKAIREAGPPPDADREALRDFDLVASVRSGDLHHVCELLGEGASPNPKIPNTFQYHYLVRCEAAGDDWDVALNIGGTQGPGSFKDAGRPVLSLALELGHDGIARELILAGAEIGDAAESDFGGTGRTPLFEAAENGRRDLLRILIAAGADVNVRDNQQHTPLMLAAQNGHAEVARDLIAAGADVNARTIEKVTPLSLAIEKGEAALMGVLLEAGARPRPNDPEHAAISGKVECTRLLLEACRKHGVTPSPDTLGFAISSNSPELVRMLIDSGVDVNASAKLWTPVMTACQRPLEFLRMLVEAGADVNARDNQGLTPLSLAPLLGSVDHVRFLLEHGADPNGRQEGGDRDGETPLMRICGRGPAAQPHWRPDPERMHAILARDEAIIRLLLDAGADVNAGDRDGRNALMHAARKRQPSLAQLVLDAGADVRVADTRHGRTALHWAVVDGNPEIVRRLLDAGADRFAEDLDGLTPHALAVREGKPDVEPLLRIGADEPAPRRSPARAFREAIGAGDVSALRAVLAEGVDPDTRLSEGRTGLIVASEGGQDEVALTLIDAGADPNIADAEGRTPLLLAIESANLEIVRSLLRAGANPGGFGRMHGGDRTTPLIHAITWRGIALTRDIEDSFNESREAPRFEDTHLEIARALIDAGAPLDAEDGLGNRPLWYALDTGEAEVADLLIAAGAGKDSISPAYLEARSMPERAEGPAFRAIVREFASLCGSEPKPLNGRPSQLEWTQARDGFPTGPTLGARFSVPREAAEPLIDAHQEEFRRRGAFLLLYSRYSEDFDFSVVQLGLLAASDWETVLAAVCSPSTDWGWVCPAFYIRDLRSLAADYPFRLVGCESRSLTLDFSPQLSDTDDLAERLGAIRTHLGGPGLPEYPDTEDVAEALRRDHRIGFYWE